jgi:hypothetical protein
MKIIEFFTNRKWPSWTSQLVALLGLLIYLLQSVLFAHTTPSNLDEGGYLYKGFLFAEGVYRPFEPYGVWTNKAPLAFLIPGYVQTIFEPGLRTGRYLAVLEGTLAVIGVWIVTCRMSTRWLASGAVWIMAVNSATIKVYSVGATQSLVACLLSWMLVFSLGEKKPLWQLMLSAILASVSILVRQNMILVLPVLLLYIFWQHGWKAGLWASIFGCGIFVIGHVIYWPEILQIWVGWIPSAIRPAGWQAYAGDSSSGTSMWNPSVLTSGRILSVFQGFRWHFVTLTGSLFTLLFLSRRERWWTFAHLRAIIFLGTLFFGLLFMHAYASIDKDYCVFCFSPYLSFFSVIGLVFVFAAFSTRKAELSFELQVVSVLLLLLISAGVGFATFEDTGAWLANLPFPRMRDGGFLPGFNTIGEVLFNKFGLDQGSSRKISALAAGTAIGFLLIAVVFFINAIYLKRKKQYAYLLTNAFLIVGFVLSPITQGSQGSPDCKIDVIAANEEIGKYLRDVLPAGSTVYWDGGLSVAPLLYAPHVRIYPPQINDGYAYYTGGDADELLRKGLWNDELAALWKMEADIIIVEEWRYPNWKPFLNPTIFEELPRSPEATSCLDGTRLRIFKRIE